MVIIENGARHFRLMRWGFIRPGSRIPARFTLLINARSETVQEKPAFKNAIKRRRCLIPADGYYEWQDAGGRKRPYFIHRRDGARSALPRWRKPGWARTARSSTRVAIVTAPASADLAVLHHRVPVTIAPDDFERWLDCRADDAETRDGAVDADREQASSPGTRFRRGSITSPMTMRN